MKQFDGYGTKIVYNGPVRNLEYKDINNLYSTTSMIFKP